MSPVGGHICPQREDVDVLGSSLLRDRPSTRKLGYSSISLVFCLCKDDVVAYICCDIILS